MILLQYSSSVFARDIRRCAAIKDGIISIPCVKQFAACSIQTKTKFHIHNIKLEMNGRIYHELLVHMHGQLLVHS